MGGSEGGDGGVAGGNGGVAGCTSSDQVKAKCGSPPPVDRPGIVAVAKSNVVVGWEGGSSGYGRIVSGGDGGAAAKMRM